MMKIFFVLCVCEVAIARKLMDRQENDHSCGLVASPNPIHQHPWLVHLEYYRHGMPIDKRCGGSLISSRHVITAAHCVRNAVTKNGRLFARLGEYDLSKVVDCVGGVCAHLPVKLEVVLVTMHPSYREKPHDIAILTLARDAPYTKTIRPICLPSGKLRDRMIFSASGWGEIIHRGVYSDVKKDIRIPYYSASDCQRAFHNEELSHMICAGGEKDMDTCRGDSGGPLVWGKHYFELWGVTSAGNNNCGTKGVPGIYTNVIAHREWIERVINKGSYSF